MFYLLSRSQDTLSKIGRYALGKHRTVALSLDPSGAQSLADERAQLDKDREALSKQVREKNKQ
jgi:hypothetical protein